jgi:hypothetical protein
LFDFFIKINLQILFCFSDTDFVKVDGIDISSRLSTINSQGKYLTLWMSRSTVLQPSESIPHNDNTFLSPPQSASSSSQIITNSITITFDDILMPTNTTLDDDDQFWNSLSEQSAPVISENTSTTITTTNDTVSDIYLTLLHSTNKNSSPIKSRTEHDRTVNTLVSDVLWPLIVDQTNRRNEKKTSSSTTATTQSLSSNSSIASSTIRRNRLYKQLPSTVKSRRSHPYTTA